ncbi:MAG: four helix bundle protein [Pseudomonadota bacterium]
MGTAFAKKFSELEVYKKAYAISLDVHKQSLNFPKIEQYALADQIRRASKSVCANIAEGFLKQRNSKSEFNRYVLIALGSSGEMEVWVNYAHDLGYINNTTAELWKSEYEVICKMLQKLSTSLKK